MKQLKLFQEKIVLMHGDGSRKGKRKMERPFFTTLPTHLIYKATRDDLLLPNKELIESLIHNYAARFGVKIFKCAVHADHIHLLLQFPNRDAHNQWNRTFTAIAVRKIPGLQWQEIPFTRNIRWGRDFDNVSSYIDWNNREANFMLHAHKELEAFQINFRAIYARHTGVGPCQILTPAPTIFTLGRSS